MMIMLGGGDYQIQMNELEVSYVRTALKSIIALNGLFDKDRENMQEMANCFAEAGVPTIWECEPYKSIMEKSIKH